LLFSERELTLAICRHPFICLSVSLSSVCNVRAPYSGDGNFWQRFNAIWYLGLPLTSMENSMEVVPKEPLHRGGGLNARRVGKYSDFGPVDGYISETVRDRR